MMSAYFWRHEAARGGRLQKPHTARRVHRGLRQPAEVGSGGRARATGAALHPRSVTIPQQRGAAGSQRPLFARLKQRLNDVVHEHPRKVIDGLLECAPVGTYAATAEQAVREV